jgi:hypothetical protein
MPIPRFILRLLTAIQLTRLTMALGAVSDLWLVVVVSRAAAAQSSGGALPLPAVPGMPGAIEGLMRDLVHEPSAPTLVSTMPLSGALLASLVVALGLFAFGASLNDLLDVRHDTAFSPDRPIPAGRIRASQAVVVSVAALLAAMVSATAFGQSGLLLAAVTALGILFYNAAGKHIPAIGLVTIAVVHSTHMFIPNVALSFTLPVWLVSSHAMAVSAIVHHLEEKRPPISPRSAATALAGYGLVSLTVLGLGLARGGLAPPGLTVPGLVWPLLAVLGFAVVAHRKTRGVPGRIAAEKLRRYGAMWQALYGAAWLLALGLERAAAGLGLFALAGFAAMTLIKEVNGMTGRPVAFRA